MGIKERIILFIKSQKISTSEFERRSCLSNGYVNNIRDGMGADKLECVLRAFPMLNRVWLLTGEGEMLNPSIIQNNRNGDNNYGHSVKVEKTTDIDKLLNTISDCHSLLQKKDEQIDRLLTLLENSRN